MPPKPQTRRPLYYTFGNHMHWVDMQWLWGYGVLPGSVADMLHLCREAGVRGNVNFDGIGYEKMAAECPESLALLREAVTAGVIEPVGCSYGQPYGLFQGGESNVRQLTYGARATQRLLGVRPRAFWEEEFYFFPQLPQMLAQCGFESACLFFQWTWHTPELPKERHSLILWEGIDGTRLPALPRNDLNVHQWPEDFDGLLDSGLINELAAPAVVQWLELMPSRDWMCRSELLLPRLKELMADPRFDVRVGTVSELVAALREAGGRGSAELPVRRYSMDDVWHGMTAGKNADRHPRQSREVEASILNAEAISSLAGLMGRPYPSWDVYPTWELEDAWRELLAAQHHDNHECEGLCGFVATGQFARARMLAEEAAGRAHRQLSDRVGAALAVNALGFERKVYFAGEDDEVRSVVVPPFGYAPASGAAVESGRIGVARDGRIVRLERDDLVVEVDVEAGVIAQIRTAAHPGGILSGDAPLGRLTRVIGGRVAGLPRIREVELCRHGVTLWLDQDITAEGETLEQRSAFQGLMVRVEIPPDAAAVDLTFEGLEQLARPDPGFRGAIRMPIAPRWEVAEIRADTPFAAGKCEGGPAARRKYPEGDWMTSPQWFEDVAGSVTAQRFVDLIGRDGAGLLVLHDGTQQYFRTPRGVDAIVCAYDPWDERRYEPDFHARAAFRIVPHRGLRDSDRVRAGLAFNAGGLAGRPERYPHRAPVGGGAPTSETAPAAFGALEVANAPNVLAQALFRESMKSGEYLPRWAGHRMFRESNGACDHPYVIRLVEWDGEPTEVVLKLPGPVAMAAKTNLLGEVLHDGPPEQRASGGWSERDTGWLRVEPAEPPAWAAAARIRGEEVRWSQVRFWMRPREIATIYADLVLGRKAWRDLDAKREVWATIHKQPTDS